MKHDPHDPAGEYYVPIEGCYCAEEGWVQRETMDDPRSDVFESPMTVTDHCVRVLREREIIGTATYNRPLMSRYKDLHEWLEDAIEECADQLQYLVAALESLEEYERESLTGGFDSQDADPK